GWTAWPEPGGARPPGRGAPASSGSTGSARNRGASPAATFGRTPSSLPSCSRRGCRREKPVKPLDGGAFKPEVTDEPSRQPVPSLGVGRQHGSRGGRRGRKPGRRRIAVARERRSAAVRGRTDQE